MLPNFVFWNKVVSYWKAYFTGGSEAVEQLEMRQHPAMIKRDKNEIDEYPDLED